MWRKINSDYGRFIRQPRILRGFLLQIILAGKSPEPIFAVLKTPRSSKG